MVGHLQALRPVWPVVHKGVDADDCKWLDKPLRLVSNHFLL